MPIKNPKVILITGCSSGFGLLAAARLSSQGHHVIATMRNLEKQHNLINEVKLRGGEVEILRLDVTDADSIRDVINSISTQHGYIDVVVNNAGYGMAGFFEDLTDKEIRDQMETNLYGVMNVTRAAIPLMRNRRRPKIINISSIAGFSSTPCFVAYNTSKFALEGFSEALYYELKPFGIDVLLIEPGVYPTPIFFENRNYCKNFENQDSPYYARSQHLSNKVNDMVGDSHKDPEEVAALIEKLINARFPRFRNIPDLESQIRCLLKGIIPFRIYSWIINTVLYKGISKGDGSQHSGKNVLSSIDK